MKMRVTIEIDTDPGYPYPNSLEQKKFEKEMVRAINIGLMGNKWNPDWNDGEYTFSYEDLEEQEGYTYVLKDRDGNVIAHVTDQGKIILKLEPHRAVEVG